MSGVTLEIELASGADDALVIEPQEEFTGFGGLHGGYVVAMLLRAAASTNVGGRPISIAANLLEGISPERIELIGERKRSGSSISTVAVEAFQDGGLKATASVIFGAEREGIDYEGLAMPDVNPPEECQTLGDKPDSAGGVIHTIDYRLAGGAIPFSGADTGELLMWMRLVEEQPIDLDLATVLADGCPPALAPILTEPLLIPSVEINIHFADVEAGARSPWALGHVRTTRSVGGYASEDGALWTPTGELILQTRQLRRVLAGRG